MIKSYKLTMPYWLEGIEIPEGTIVNVDTEHEDESIATKDPDFFQELPESQEREGLDGPCDTCGELVRGKYSESTYICLSCHPQQTVEKEGKVIEEIAKQIEKEMPGLALEPDLCWVCKKTATVDSYRFHDRYFHPQCIGGKQAFQEKEPKIEISMDAKALGLCPSCFEKPCKCQPQDKEESKKWGCKVCQKMIDLWKEVYVYDEGCFHYQCYSQKEECKHENLVEIPGSINICSCKGCGVIVKKPQPKQKPSEWIRSRIKYLEYNVDFLHDQSIQAILDFLDEQFN